MSADAGALGIAELGGICARMAAASLDLFEELGAWVTRVSAGPEQRWYATACHRHAWHAELWARRWPDVADHDFATSVAGARGTLLPADPDVAAYRHVLDTLVAELAQIGGRVERDLDPATLRTVALVRSDLADLLDR